jgi:hypothetical protein
MIWRGDIDRAVSDRQALLRLTDRKPPGRRNDRRQDADSMRRDMQNDEDRRLEIDRETPQDLPQWRRRAGGAADDDDIAVADGTAPSNTPLD